MRGGGRAAPRWAWQWVQKDGCAQRTGAHSRPKPTSSSNILLMSRPPNIKYIVPAFFGDQFGGKDCSLWTNNLPVEKVGWLDGFLKLRTSISHKKIQVVDVPLSCWSNLARKYTFKKKNIPRYNLGPLPIIWYLSYPTHSRWELLHIQIYRKADCLRASLYGPFMTQSEPSWLPSVLPQGFIT